MNGRSTVPRRLLRLCGRFLFCCECCRCRYGDRTVHENAGVAHFLCQRDAVDARADDERGRRKLPARAIEPVTEPSLKATAVWTASSSRTPSGLP